MGWRQANGVWRQEAGWSEKVVIVAGSPPTVRSSAFNSAAVSTTTVPSIGAGDLVIWLHTGYTYSSGGGTVSSPNLGTFSSHYYDVTGIGAVYWAVNVGGALTNEVITTTEGSARATYGISIAGANTSSPFDGVGVQGASTSNSGSISLTTTAANELVIAVTSGGSADSSPWVSMSGNAYGGIAEYNPAASIATYTAAFGGATGNSTFMFAIKS